MFNWVWKLKPVVKHAENVRQNRKVIEKSIRYFSSTIEDEGFDISELSKGDANLEHKLKVLQLETDVLRHDGKNVPSQAFMKKKHWEEMLKLETRSARRKYLDFVFKIEKKRENEIIKKESKKFEREQIEYEPRKIGALCYELGHNNIMLRIHDATMNQMYNNKLIQAMQFSQKIVVDCGYDDHMIQRESINCAKQMMLMFSENRYHDEPFDMHFCNTNKDSHLMKYLQKFIPTMYDEAFPFNIHENSYLDLFEKDKLVYLTPHCREELLEYDHDAVYIIGGIVDKINNEPVSLAKAKREGIKMAKLPLDRYLQWGAGSGKSLTLNQMISIMLDIRRSGDWNYALKHVPRRKILENPPEVNFRGYKGLRYDKDFGGEGRRENRVTWRPGQKAANDRTSLKENDRSRLKIKDILYD